jgi:hypothetical protein
MFNVGVDIHNYFPVSSDIIKEYFKEFYV